MCDKDMELLSVCVIVVAILIILQSEVLSDTIDGVLGKESQERSDMTSMRLISRFIDLWYFYFTLFFGIHGSWFETRSLEKQ
jgi:hypothetical protein